MEIDFSADRYFAQKSENSPNSYLDLQKSSDPRITIHNWLRGRDIVEFLGLWEALHNPDFKRIDFDAFKENAGTNAFVFSIKKWNEELGAVGLLTKSGRYGGGIYAHMDIALEFASWLSPEFKLYIIKDYKRLKYNENSHLSLGWNLNQLLVLANMESYNAILIEQNKAQAERMVMLRDMAIKQMETLESLSISALKQLPGGENL